MEYLAWHTVILFQKLAFQNVHWKKYNTWLFIFSTLFRPYCFLSPGRIAHNHVKLKLNCHPIRSFCRCRNRTSPPFILVRTHNSRTVVRTAVYQYTGIRRSYIEYENDVCTLVTGTVRRTYELVHVRRTVPRVFCFRVAFQSVTVQYSNTTKD